MKYILFSIVFMCYSTLFSQEYTDYIGAGHSTNITVTSSSEQTRTDWNEVAQAVNTINGKGLDSRLLETSRFLAQATFGTDLDYINPKNSRENFIIRCKSLIFRVLNQKAMLLKTPNYEHQKYSFLSRLQSSFS